MADANVIYCPHCGQAYFVQARRVGRSTRGRALTARGAGAGFWSPSRSPAEAFRRRPRCPAHQRRLCNRLSNRPSRSPRRLLRGKVRTTARVRPAAEFRTALSAIRGRHVSPGTRAHERVGYFQPDPRHPVFFHPGGGQPCGDLHWNRRPDKNARRATPEGVPWRSPGWCSGSSRWSLRRRW